MEDSKHVRDQLKFQFNISWQLLEYHLSNLENQEVLWQPTVKSLHMNKVEESWIADWPETEDYEMGPASIAWYTWHIQFWWSMVFDYSFGEGILTKEEVIWPGNIEEVKRMFNQFHDRWVNLLETIPDKDLIATGNTKWPFKGVPFYQLAGWLNLELMKNAAEIGSIRFMYGSKKNS